MSKFDSWIYQYSVKIAVLATVAIVGLFYTNLMETRDLIDNFANVEDRLSSYEKLGGERFEKLDISIDGIKSDLVAYKKAVDLRIEQLQNNSAAINEEVKRELARLDTKIYTGLKKTLDSQLILSLLKQIEQQGRVEALESNVIDSINEFLLNLEGAD